MNVNKKMSSGPLVSVIIPNYNHKRFLKKRIDSVLSQTYQNMEIIYLDDASNDGSEEVFAAYSHDRRIRSYKNEKNSGSPFVQWNKGVELANGDMIWIAEADDYSDPQFLKCMVSVLEENQNAGIAYCQSVVVDELDRTIAKGTAYTDVFDNERWSKPFVANGRTECATYLYVKNTIPNASAVLINTSLYRQVGGADTKYKLCGDWHLWAKMLMTSDICFVSEPYNYFRQHAGTVRSSQTKLGRHFEELYMVRKYIQSIVKVDRRVIENESGNIAKRVAKAFLVGSMPLPQFVRISRLGWMVEPRFPLKIFMALLREGAVRTKRVFAKTSCSTGAAATKQ